MSPHTALLATAFVVQVIFWIVSTTVLLLGITSSNRLCVLAGLAGVVVSSLFISALAVS